MPGDDKLPPLPPIPRPPGSAPSEAVPADASPPDPPPPPPRSAPLIPPPPGAPPRRPSKSGSFRHLESASRVDQLQDFARTGFAGYSRVVVVEKKRRPGLAWWLAGTLVLVAVAVAVYQWTRSPVIEETLPDSLASVGAAPAETGTIDPEPWRSDLEALEAFLFAPPSEIGPLGSFGSRFEEEAGAFADRLRVEGGEQEGVLADGLDGLITQTQRSDFNVRRLKKVRQAWLDLRAIYIGDADWLLDPGTADEAADLEVYRLAAEQVRDLLSTTLAAAEELSSSGMSSTRRRQEWRQTLFYYRDDLKVIRAALPRRPPAGAPAEELEAIHRIDRVFIGAEDIAARQKNLSNLDLAAFEAAIDEADEAAAFFDRRLES